MAYSPSISFSLIQDELSYLHKEMELLTKQLADAIATVKRVSEERDAQAGANYLNQKALQTVAAQVRRVQAIVDEVRRSDPTESEMDGLVAVSRIEEALAGTVIRENE